MRETKSLATESGAPVNSATILGIVPGGLDQKAYLGSLIAFGRRYVIASVLPVLLKFLAPDLPSSRFQSGPIQIQSSGVDIPSL